MPDVTSEQAAADWHDGQITQSAEKGVKGIPSTTPELRLVAREKRQDALFCYPIYFDLRQRLLFLDASDDASRA